MVLAYFTPEVALPVASVVAAAFGFLMMVGRAPFQFLARGLRSLKNSEGRTPGPKGA
ncbi:MAG: hypothetical protein U0790_25610 [Isosphaeraceae bacterium]